MLKLTSQAAFRRWRLGGVRLFQRPGVDSRDRHPCGAVGFGSRQCKVNINLIKEKQNGTQVWLLYRSILAAILFHFSGNAFGELFALSQQAEVYNTLLFALTTLLIIAIGGARTLTAASERRSQWSV